MTKSAKQRSIAGLTIQLFFSPLQERKRKKFFTLFSFTVAQIPRNCTDFSMLFWIYSTLKEIRIQSHMSEEQNIHIHSKHIFLSRAHRAAMLSLAMTDYVLFVYLLA